MTGLTLLLLAAWSIGRIDMELPSRPGAVSFLAVGTLLPILYVIDKGFPPYWVRGAFALLIAIFAAMHGLQDRFSVAQLTSRAFPRSEVPANLERVSSGELGGSRFGTVFISPERRAEIAGFKDALTHVLAPGQTYFDLTNRQALYYYLGLPVPALYSATFNALNENQQQRMLRQLTRKRPLPFSSRRRWRVMASMPVCDRSFCTGISCAATARSSTGVIYFWSTRNHPPFLANRIHERNRCFLTGPSRIRICNCCRQVGERAGPRSSTRLVWSLNW
jgi:hypothetical protein